MQLRVQPGLRCGLALQQGPMAGLDVGLDHMRACGSAGPWLQGGVCSLLRSWVS